MARRLCCWKNAHIGLIGHTIKDAAATRPQLEAAKRPIKVGRHHMETRSEAMPDCFISYSSHDQQLADFICSQIRGQGLDVFMAPLPIAPGDQWPETIKQNLLSSAWVIFLASAEACKLPYVQQGLGAALGASKRVVPVVWDMSPNQLPGWTSQYAVLNLRSISFEDLKDRIEQISRQNNQDKLSGLLILGAILFGLFWLESRPK
jgi:hypothetical protein